MGEAGAKQLSVTHMIYLLPDLVRKLNTADPQVKLFSTLTPLLLK